MLSQSVNQIIQIIIFNYFLSLLTQIISILNTSIEHV